MWKTCKNLKCLRNNPQPINNFNKNARYDDGLNPQCKDCVAHYQKKNRSKMIEAGKRWAAKNGQKIRFHHLERTYGITQIEYNQMLKDQNGTCAICGRNNKGRALNVDHDHETNVIRGLLCNMCNTGLGSFNDDTVTLEKAVEYLKKWKETHVSVACRV